MTLDLWGPGTGKEVSLWPRAPGRPCGAGSAESAVLGLRLEPEPPFLAMDESEDEPDRPEVDLHGLSPEQALRRVRQELHAARVRGYRRLLVITGRGWGNPSQKPVLRQKIADWLASPEALELGVRRFDVMSQGGALEVVLGPRGSREQGPGASDV